VLSSFRWIVDFALPVPMCMEPIVVRRGWAPHPPGGSKNTVEGRHAATGCGRRKLLLRHIFRRALPGLYDL
jgi:hypothetical protein